MTKINREQFRKEFHDGINIDSLSNETRTALKNAGISKARLKEIANGDRKIEGAEIEKLFDVMDSFDMQPSDGYLDTSINPGISTPTGEAYDRLKSEYDRNAAINILRGPQLQNSKPDSTNPKVSLFNGPHGESARKKNHHHSNDNRPELHPSDYSSWQRGLWATASHQEREAAISKELKARGYGYDKKGLEKAAKDGDIDALKLFKRENFPGLNKTFFSFVKVGNSTAVRAFLEAGMDPNVTDKEGRTPLMLAGNGETIDALIAMNADVTVKDKYGMTALMHHIKLNGDGGALSQSLLEKTKDANAIDERDSQGRTALHYAAFMGHLSAATQLIEFGADIDAQADNKLTPLSMAVSSNKLSLARVLMEKGADPFGHYDKDGEFPLAIAIRNGDKDMVQLVLDHISDDRQLNYWDEELKTPLDVAIEMGNPEMVDLLQSRGAMTSADKLEEESAMGR